jgi:hypothetical protein
MKREYVTALFLYRPKAAIETRLRRYARWVNQERPHQGRGNRTPDQVYRGRPSGAVRNVTSGMLHVRFLDGDRRLPILRLANAA